MNGRQFVDTNILVYAFDLTAGEKRTLATSLVERLWAEHSGCLSLQVLQEFYVTTTKKLGMPAADAARQIARFANWKTHRPALEDILAAIDLHQRRRIAFWDAMVVRSAMTLDCSVLWSEDLSHGEKWEGVLVQNPFAT